LVVYYNFNILFYNFKKLFIFLVINQKITHLTSNILALNNNFEFLSILEQNINCCCYIYLYIKKYIKLLIMNTNKKN
jgi:hypothetical protein